MTLNVQISGESLETSCAHVVNPATAATTAANAIQRPILIAG